jgi:hypothetical protein
MPLKPIRFSVEVTHVSVEADRLVRDAEARIERFVHRRRNDPLPAFVPSDFRLSYATLALIRDRHLAPDMTMCEWGSGFGVTACLATLLGYDACGIEIERDLNDESQALADAHELPTQFVHGSFIPDGGDHLAVDTGESAWLSTDLPAAYDELGVGVEDFGLIYAYPWPGEEQTIERIFEAYAATGALLVTYRGMNHIHIHRKISRKRMRHASI